MGARTTVRRPQERAEGEEEHSPTPVLHHSIGYSADDGADDAAGHSAGHSAEVGRRGEDLVARYLEDAGWQVLERNWRPTTGRRGELDVIALDPGPASGQEQAAQGRGDAARQRPVLVVVEVKTRTSLGRGCPAEAVGARKIARIRSLAALWVATHRVVHGGTRIDVVSVLLRSRRPALLRHHRGVAL
ncbi:YraN family protein [Actinomyces wuliandei]|uniref:YraN family protein n=1 Tax=Actinomyces wuliandei TaxID=2057743 RepID=UPI001FAAB6CC|nr:YraN family protein [Actinomyces wuliandei]